MRTDRLCAFLALVLVAGIAGCRGKEDEENGTEKDAPAPVAEESSEGKEPFPKEKATASIAGKILFEGEAPEPKAIRIQGDAFCEHHAAEDPPKDESLLVNGNKTLRNVFVHITKGLDRFKFDVPKEPVVVTQKNCRYRPHVVGIQVGQALEIKSEDDTTHNVHFIGAKNREFNLTQKKGQVDSKRFTRPETGTAFLKCDVHSWMKGHVGIVRHPFFTVTGEEGTFDLGKLPPGEYEVEAWHETLGAQTRTVTVKDGESATLEFTFAMK